MSRSSFEKLGQVVKYLVLVVFIISGCVPEAGKVTSIEMSDELDQQPAYAEVLFSVDIPQSTPPSQSIYLEILDEITGLGLNPLRYQLTPTDLTHYSVRIPLVVGSVVKYRYVRESSPPAVEYTSAGEQVRYRLFYVTGHSEVVDYVSAWSDLAYQGPMGRITGKLLDSETNLPARNILVAAGGDYTITASDGSFILDQLSLGTHNLVAYSMDGAYHPFQQGAVVAADAATPAELKLTPSKYVTVTFIVNSPEGSVPGIPIRMIGNIYQLGNTFADLSGGFSAISARAPFLTLTSEGIYVLMLSLPAGLDLRYKYTLGDGFWNGEHAEGQPFRVRQLIVPETDTVIQDGVETWKSGETAPITFSVKTPADTPATDSISIQFNPYSWTEPVPMWPLGDGQWMYMLYGPQEMLGEVGYRFCRNDQCGSADDSASPGMTALGYSFSQSAEPQTLEHEITSWAWWGQEVDETTNSPTDVIPRSSSFMTGVEYQLGYYPTWQPYIGWGLDYISELGADWVVVTPTWHSTSGDLPGMEISPGEDLLWPDATQICFWAAQRNLGTVIFPIIEYEGSANEWWESAERDAGWWQSWRDRYKTYLLHHADLASEVQAEALVIGGPGLEAAMPGGTLSDGSPSGVPGDIEDWWKLTISDIRGHYAGKLIWALPYNGVLNEAPDFLSDVDIIYILWSTRLSESNTPSDEELMDEIGRMIDSDIFAVKEEYQKPIILGIDYASVDGSSAGCVEYGEDCLPFSTMDQTLDTPVDVLGDLKEQEAIYTAMLSAINQRDWVQGFISRGFYPPAALQDTSSSVYGKPAAGVVRQWFSVMDRE